MYSYYNLFFLGIELTQDLFYYSHFICGSVIKANGSYLKCVQLLLILSLVCYVLLALSFWLCTPCTYLCDYVPELYVVSL